MDMAHVLYCLALFFFFFFFFKQKTAYEMRISDWSSDVCSSDLRLQEYRAGTTSESDPHLFNIMAEVTKSLTDEEIDSLGSYLQGLHERPDAATLIAMANAPAAAAAPAAEPAPAPEDRKSTRLNSSH